jgi:signal transduction histidine kinase
LLTFSRITPPSSEELSIEDLIERSVLLCRHKLELSKIELKVGHGQGIPPVRGDFNQLQQCLINLIFNAVDALAGGGCLEISSRYERTAGRAIIRVTDDGPGIPPEHLPHVFEPFYTTKAEGYGVGLGLSTVYGIVERHGGTVTAESRTAQGATFTIELPI